MDRVVETIVDAVLGLSGPLAYTAVGLLAFGEAAAFIGLVTPGEIAMVLGGVLSSRARVDLTTMLAVAATGAVLGDSAGYWLGRIYGHRMTRWRPLRERFSGQIERTRHYFQRRGGSAIVFGRYASVVKVFVPFVAGASRMTYPRFLLFSVPAGASWAAAFVVLGYLAGQSWHLVERVAGRASFVVLLVVVIGFAIRLGAKRAIANQERLRAAARRARATRPVRFVEDRFGSQLAWLVRRFDPTLARGLSLTLAWLVLTGGLLAAGMILNDVAAFEGLALLDVPTRVVFSRIRSPESVAVARVVAAAFSVPWALLPAAAAVAWAAWRADVGAAVRTAVGVAAATGVAFLVQSVITERVVGTQFPSVPVTVAAALALHAAAAVWMRGEWAAAVKTAGSSLFVVAVVSVAALLTERATFTGVLFGLALGVTAAAAVEVQARMPFRSVDEELGQRLEETLPPR